MHEWVIVRAYGPSADVASGWLSIVTRGGIANVYLHVDLQSLLLGLTACLKQIDCSSPEAL